jgi:hypothetical protein
MFRYGRTWESTLAYSGVLLAVLASACRADSPPLTLTHSWIVVRPGAPERKVLESAGFCE